MEQYLGFTLDALEKQSAVMTAKEINQQPSSWAKALKNLDAQKAQVLDFIQPVMAADVSRIIFTGAGTSAFVGHSIAPAVRTITGKRTESIATTDIVSNPYQYFSEDIPTLLISFARSGNSPESVAAVDLANQCLSNVRHLLITCNEKGALFVNGSKQDNALPLLMPAETNDGSFAMTSSFSSMMLTTLSVFFLSQGSVAERFGYIAENTEKLIPRYVDYVKSIIDDGIERIIYLGSGGLQGLAQESALKILELTAGQVVATYDSPMGFRHGPKSIVNNKTMIVEYLSNNEYTRLYDVDLLKELRRDGIARRVTALTALSDESIVNPDVLQLDGFENAHDFELLFPYIVFAQIYALYSSLKHNITPDNPCPTGEVNRVVQGVIIHKFTN
ncbi:SIS domain-containing protein [Spirabiliibacterium falconis]|uniref:SIS domain-containing protein n=1 Tax=Spirabiliibacterium falconis TaxID=572023 RepID=UPI001AAD08E3|nr:SIS domain-containing protein [Spirabiliibacterium falconis]MBE2894704.1 SIS domain-containing protein [Spirabiliibacterium falconis]